MFRNAAGLRSNFPSLIELPLQFKCCLLVGFEFSFASIIGKSRWRWKQIWLTLLWSLSILIALYCKPYLFASWTNFRSSTHPLINNASGVSVNKHYYRWQVNIVMELLMLPFACVYMDLCTNCCTMISAPIVLCLAWLMVLSKRLGNVMLISAWASPPSISLLIL